jgi:hypothetical protein
MFLPSHWLATLIAAAPREWAGHLGAVLRLPFQIA